MGFPLTGYQVKIKEAVSAAIGGTGSKNIIIEANAGCGKTTTLVNVVLPLFLPTMKVLCATFGKRINDEMISKVAQASGIACSPFILTLHSVGNKIIAKNWGFQRMNNYREQNLAEKHLKYSRKEHRSTLIGIGNIAQRSKEMYPFATRENLEEIADLFDFYTPAIEKEGISLTEILDSVERVLELSKKRDGTISFADMIWLPLAMGWAKGEYDAVIIDECQDLNLSQIILAQKVLKVGGITIIIGDSRQAIFAFRGADSKSIQRLRDELPGAVELKLPETFRCGKVIVELAKEIVPTFIAHESNHEGTISEMLYQDIFKSVKPGDAILSRKNAPLAGTCLKLWLDGVKAQIEGRDFGKGITNLIDTLTKKRNTLLGKFLETLDAYARETETRLAKKRGGDQLISDLWDKVECLEILSDGLGDTDELKKRVEGLFKDTDKTGRRGMVTLSSVHRAKGLEWDRVFGLAYTLMDHSEEEHNLRYVMITRAKHDLILVGKDAE